jgi:hypothetical protein
MTWRGGIDPITSPDTVYEFLNEVWLKFDDEQKSFCVLRLSRCLTQSEPVLTPIACGWFLWALSHNQ